MAHGFLTPTSVSGDNFWSNVQDLWKKLQELKKRKAPPEEVVPVVVNELQNALPPGRQKLLSSGKQQSVDKPKALNMLSGSPVTKMLGSGKSEITIKQQPQLPAGGLSSSKGGTFTNLPGISSAPKKLDSEAFFKAAQTGVNPETGQYLTSGERKEYLKKSKATMNAPASVAAGGINSASSIAQVTRGDEEIVSSVENLTKVVVSLVSAVKAQTTAQLKAATAQKASTERTANRALAAAEESSLEQGSDLSGAITPTYGTNSGTLMPPAAGGGGGGAGGGPAFGIGGKATAQAVGKRGLSRALPRLGAHVAGKTGAKLGAKVGGKAAAKIGTSALAKGLAKKIPGLGLLAGLGFGVQRLLKGDFLGAGMEVASGAASTLPGLGTAGSIGIDAALAARDMGATPFAAGGIISSPTLSMMGEGNKKEGVFPLQGREGKKTFEMFGQGMIDAQKKNSRDFAAIQAKGLRQYYENEDGFKKMGEIFGKVFEGLKDILGNIVNTLLGGAANAATGNPADYLGGAAGGQDMMTLATVAALESGSAQGQADVAQSVYNRLRDKTYKGKNITDLLTRDGQYQVAFKDPTATSGAGTQVADVFKNIKTEDDAVKAIMFYYNKRGQKITEEQARKKLRGSVAAIQNTELQQKAAQHVGGRTDFLGYDNGLNAQVHRGGGSDNYFGAQYGNKSQNVKMGAAAIPTGLFTPSSGGGSPSIASAAQSLKGMDTSGGPGGGSVSCVYAVNKVFDKAGVKPPWGGAQSTDAVINGVRRAGWQQVGFGDAKPGDLWAYDANDGRSGHVGIMMPNGKVLSNSTSNKKFTWEADRATLLNAYPKNGMTPPGGVFFRPPGGGSGGSIARPPAAKPTPATANRGGQRGSGSSPGSLQASAANQNNGTAMMATSAQVQMGAMGLTTPGGNVINNIYNTGGQQSSPMGNTLSAGTPSGNAGLSWLALVRR